MRLQEYIDEVGISKTEFARRCGLSVATVFNLVREDSNKDVRLSVAKKIFDYTKGKVQPFDLLSLPKKIVKKKS